MNNETKKPHRKSRQIIVVNKEYYWLLATWDIVIWDEDRKKTTYNLSKVTGLSPDEIERGQYKRYFSVKPRHITKMIKQINVGTEPKFDYYSD